MVATYNAAELSASPLFRVRLLIGDTDVDHANLQDEEIQSELNSRGSVKGAAANCCLLMAAQLMRRVDRQAGGSRIWSSQAAKSLRQQAAILESEAASAGSGAPYAGGLSVTDKERQECDPDRVQPQFNIGLEDNNIPNGPAQNEVADGTAVSKGG